MENVGGEFETFAKAFRAFYDAINKLIAEGTTWQVLETTCWIEYTGTTINFHEARDIACLWKILVDGKLAASADDITEKQIRALLDIFAASAVLRHAQ